MSRKSAYYEAPFPIYSADWTGSFGGGSSLIAVGSYSESSSNKVQVINANPILENSHNSAPKTTFEFQQSAEAAIPYPSTRIMWDPHCATSPSAFGSKVRLATSGESLRLWEYDNDIKSLNVKCVFSNSKCGSVSPVTSFDWSKVNNNHIVSSSIDTTCTVWDLNTAQAKTQLIAHDKEVYDVKYTAGSDDVFVSVGADGSIRVFDLRALDHSTIIYEPANPVPLVRLSTNPMDSNTLAAIAANENEVYILDIRSPGVPIAMLKGHKAPVNSVIWAPPNCSFGGAGATRKSILATASDDCQVLVWDVTGDNPQVVAAYSDSTEFNNLTWGADGDWIGAVSDRSIQGIRLI
ncbi:WD40 repeat-like protein [Nadsonia fulvescens var. elongata DSM 6958]|uniref:WD40 repeat-like protein n=1 Tax=Nadsonia fulvescens var. elongata DSM 6958 TaxID=857566 RepID=A0A1E3PE34_9ASCO|nr:WD40 repeat-like protein [Nadsonia fulvescens var. elongata DSM 6958]